MDPEFLKMGHNTLIVMVESFGMNRQPFALNDVRNPRGVLQCSFSKPLDVVWEIGKFTIDWLAGVDVRTKLNAFNMTGLPDESVDSKWTSLEIENNTYRLVSDKPT